MIILIMEIIDTVEFILIFSRISRYSSNLFAASAQLCKHGLDTTLVDDSHALGRHTQRHEALLRFNPKTVIV